MLKFCLILFAITLVSLGALINLEGYKSWHFDVLRGVLVVAYLIAVVNLGRILGIVFLLKNPRFAVGSIFGGFPLTLAMVYVWWLPDFRGYEWALVPVIAANFYFSFCIFRWIIQVSKEHSQKRKKFTDAETLDRKRKSAKFIIFAWTTAWANFLPFALRDQNMKIVYVCLGMIILIDAVLLFLMSQLGKASTRGNMLK